MNLTCILMQHWLGYTLLPPYQKRKPKYLVQPAEICSTFAGRSSDKRDQLIIMQAKLVAPLLQLVRYGVVGIFNNLLGYLIYVTLTWLWLEPKLAVTLMYPVGALAGYFAHACFAFKYDGRVSHGLLRYAIAHLIGYGADVFMLYVLVDRLGYPHQLVQAAAMFVVGCLLFVLFRYFVFTGRKQST